jgi:hypothetical protein
MTALLLMLLAQAPEHVRSEPTGAHCHRVRSQSPGWKTVTLPQTHAFRAGERVLLLEDREVFSHAYRKLRWGLVEIDFEVPAETQVLRLQFLQRLDGMRVEVRGGDGQGRTLPLLPERRVSGDTLDLEWNATGVRYVTILLHHHIRGAPVISGWSSGHYQPMPEAAPQLTFLYPGGRFVELCAAPNPGVTR